MCWAEEGEHQELIKVLDQYRTQAWTATWFHGGEFKKIELEG